MNNRNSKIKKGSLDDLILDAYEQEIEDSITGAFPEVSAKDKLMFAKLASQHKMLQKSKRINIRINNEDLAKVKARASENKIPYQTLIGAIVHKYAKGDLSVDL